MILVRLQKRLVRIMEGFAYSNHTVSILREIELLTLRDIYFPYTAKFMHRIYYNRLSRVSLFQFFYYCFLSILFWNRCHYFIVL